VRARGGRGIHRHGEHGTPGTSIGINIKE
jgi:hypothetical protein